MSKEKNIFEKIIDREIPAEIVYEDELFLAFLNINPMSKGHTLLIPKENYRWVQDLPDELYTKLCLEAKKLSLHIKEKLDCDFIQLMTVGKDVPHVHIHLIPRNLDDNISEPEPLKYEENELKKLSEKLRYS